MPNGEMTKISSTRLKIEVDNIAFVIDHPVDADVPLVVAEFMAQWAQKHKRDLKLIASKKLEERKAGAVARQHLVDELGNMSDDDIEQLAQERKPIAFGFPGFAPVVSEEERGKKITPPRNPPAAPLQGNTLTKLGNAAAGA